ncbi:hypothetical protein FLONG3_8112 [Fusarium longipes]|uniref:Uncharacterized protein n=1 Tax=Fusarium longipes TaxID=694270 RepID=A0A395S814_9HYPO|nr:hypothetical protein FLONG3_8112 [Fusarium longipes]
MIGLSPLAATFDLRFRHAWQLCYDDKREEAETAAAALLLEPRLGRFHQAGMHLLLAMSPDDYVEHASEAVRLYTEIGNRQDMTDFKKTHLEKLLKDANHLLNKAREDQTRIDREVQKILASGITMDELHDIQIKEMNQRLDAEDADEATAEGADMESQDATGMTEDSQMTGIGSERTESQRTDSRRTMTGHIDDDEPLPEIFRYSKKDFYTLYFVQ